MAKKFYGIDCQGVLLIPRDTAANKPAWSAGDSGRLFWETDTERMFIGGSSDWTRVVLNDGQGYSNLTIPSSNSALYA